MKFKCRPADLHKELEFLAAIVTERDRRAHPALAHVLIEVRRSGLVLTTFNLYTRLCSTLAVPVEETGTCSADAKLLLAWLEGALPYREVSFDTDGVFSPDTHTGTLHTSVPNLRGAFGTLNTEFFAPAETPVAQFTMPAALLNSMAARTKFATSTDENRHQLSGALFEAKEDGVLRMVATDGNRLALCEEQLDTKIAPFTALVRTAVLNLLPRLAVGGSVTFGQSETNLFFVAGARSITARKLSGTFPDYANVIPSNEFDTPFFAEINGEALRGGLEAVSSFADEAPFRVLFNFSNGELSLSTTRKGCVSGGGIVSVSLLSSYFTEPFVIGLSSVYLMPFLKTVNGNSIIARFGDAHSAAKFEIGSAYTYYVMPIKPD